MSIARGLICRFCGRGEFLFSLMFGGGDAHGMRCCGGECAGVGIMGEEGWMKVVDGG